MVDFLQEIHGLGILLLFICSFIYWCKGVSNIAVIVVYFHIQLKRPATSETSLTSVR